MMLKKILIMAITGIAISGCSDNKGQEKALLDSVIKVHDKVMADDGVVMKNKMQLKNIAATNKAAGVTDSVTHYSKLLDNADDVMMTWMNKFNPDFTGKSHKETMDYLNKQKELIGKINTQLDSAISASNKYITNNKAK